MNKQEREEFIDRASADMEERLAKLAADPAEWVTFVEQVAVFGARYSLGNQLLLMMQAQERGIEPRYFMPYGTRDKKTKKPKSGWLKVGRKPREGETAFRVWAPNRRRPTEEEAQQAEAAGRQVRRDPGGRPSIRLVGYLLSPTFDISQTDGEPFEVPTVQNVRRQKLHGGRRVELLTGDDPTGAFDDLVALVKGEGYSFELVDPSRLGGAGGRTVPATRLVMVRDDVDPAQRVKTAVHELAHIRCGHVNDLADYAMHRGRAETEAESVAHIVCKALGLDSEAFSDAYVLAWADGDAELVKDCAETILRVAKGILADLEPADEPDEPASEPDPWGDVFDKLLVNA